MANIDIYVLVKSLLFDKYLTVDFILKNREKIGSSHFKWIRIQTLCVIVTGPVRNLRIAQTGSNFIRLAWDPPEVVDQLLFGSNWYNLLSGYDIGYQTGRPTALTASINYDLFISWFGWNWMLHRTLCIIPIHRWIFTWFTHTCRIVLILFNLLRSKISLYKLDTKWFQVTTCR